MKNVLKTLAIGIFTLLTVSSLRAEEFSADMELKAGSESSTVKVFISVERVRMDMDELIVITDLIRKKTFALNVIEKTYIEGIMQDPVRLPRAEKRLEGEVERTLQRKETVNGYVTEKFIVRYETDQYSGSVYQWVMEGKDLAVKIEDIAVGWTIEYKNIKIENQPEILFTIPTDYTKLEMPAVL